ncbi:2-isopropylmalate synthase [Candidatus Epulonipiscium viviparus]|uniref:2-isopropylmalate synthase n=1 Tax=Candidatus Epulonipiscium viviparus TaxID=420336 RepID=UPI002738115A|nr:2-isopropylmalate synthase [Candidatus Epulopiscium viviparus]
MIKIFDTTLRDGEQAPGYSMNLSEKIEMAAQLENLGVDVIEAGFAIASKGDFTSVAEVAKLIKNSEVASLSRALKKDIDASAEALKGAAFPRIHTFIATSDIHMQYKLKKNEDQVIEITSEMVRYAKKFCQSVEFSAEDATRSRPEFLYKVLEAAITAGATVLNIPDTVGYTSPAEIYDLIVGVRENVRGIDKVDISIHCHNDLGLGVANTLSALKAGATQIECTINGIGERAGNAALEEIIMNIKTRPDIYPYETKINTKEIYPTSKLLTNITGVKVQPNKAIVGDNAFAHESGIHQHGMLSNKATYEIMTPKSIGLADKRMVLGKHSGRHAFVDRLDELGFQLPDAEIDTLFEGFKSLADKKKNITDLDIQMLAMRRNTKIPQTYKLDRFVINSGNTITTTSSMKLIYTNPATNKTEFLEAVIQSYDGPIDASYKAIDCLVGSAFSLEDFLISAVTGGTDAFGEVYVKIKNNKGNIYNGYGISVDIVEASILAYISAINNMVYEENR